MLFKYVISTPRAAPNGIAIYLNTPARRNDISSTNKVEKSGSGRKNSIYFLRREMDF